MFFSEWLFWQIFFVIFTKQIFLILNTMKKFTFLIVSLFMLYACSDEAMLPETELYTDNNDEILAPPPTASSLPGGGMYQSPFLDHQDIVYRFENNTPFILQFTPFLGHMVQNFNVDTAFNNPISTGTPPSINAPNLFKDDVQYGNVVEADPIVLPPGMQHHIMTCGSPVPVLASPWCPSPSPLIFTFANLTTPLSYMDHSLLYHSGKIYYIEYEIIDPRTTTVLASGILKQKFGNDGMTFNDLQTNGAPWSLVDNWQYDASMGVSIPASPHLFNLFPAYRAELVYHQVTEEICIVQQPGAPVLPSGYDFIDPATGTMYNLSFFTDPIDVIIRFQ